MSYNNNHNFMNPRESNSNFKNVLARTSRLLGLILFF